MIITSKLINWSKLTENDVEFHKSITYVKGILVLWRMTSPYNENKSNLKVAEVDEI
jgi:hypothetical protein